MIVGIGDDIVEHKVSKRLGWRNDQSILKRIFSPREIDLYLPTKNIRFLSGRFAAKEAILKCLGTGMQDGIALPDIQILPSESGKPIIELSGEVKKIAEAMGITHWHISISHSSTCSIARVIAEK